MIIMVAGSIKAAVNDVYNFVEGEARAAGVAFPSAELKALAAEVIKELEVVYTGIITQVEFIEREVVRHIMSSQAVQTILGVYARVWAGIARLQYNLSAAIVDGIEAIRQKVAGAVAGIVDGK